MAHLVVHFERQETGWVATLALSPKRQVRARSIAEVRTAVDRILRSSTLKGQAWTIEEVFEERLAVIVDGYRLAKLRTADLLARERKAILNAVDTLAAELSLRDVAALIGLSHQRVQQLVDQVPD